MRKNLLCLALFVTCSLFLAADHIGRIQVSDPSARSTVARDGRSFILTEQALQEMIVQGRLQSIRVQPDSMIADHSHERFQQLYNGMKVYGAQVIVERERQRIVTISGQYYPIQDLDMNENLSPEQAVEILAADIGANRYQSLHKQAVRAVFPRDDGTYRLCFQIELKLDNSAVESALVDVLDGTLYARSSSHKFETLIGIGNDYHGVARKFPHYYENGTYYLYDDHVIRPIKLATFDIDNGGYVVSGSSAYWQNKGVNVSAHYNVGLTYDFLYLFLGVQGLNGDNLDMNVVTNRTQYTDNAYWDGQNINFCKTGSMNAQYAASLDIVAHECAHGVTQFNSNLTYSFQSGALNESFSDIVGSSVEQYWQPAGKGLFCADWYIGEDAFPSYSYGINKGYVRYMANPNKFSQFHNANYPDPCHLSQYYNLPFATDRGGVHVNMTIFSHAYYLLAVGGTNPVSKKTVSAIGMEKALKIFWRAWVYKLSESSTFQNAAQALLNSAYDLYGSGSTEYAQTVKMLQAIGYTVS